MLVLETIRFKIEQSKLDRLLGPDKQMKSDFIFFFSNPGRAGPQNLRKWFFQNLNQENYGNIF